MVTCKVSVESGNVECGVTAAYCDGFNNLMFNFRHFISLRMEDSTVGGRYVLIYDQSGP